MGGRTPGPLQAAAEQFPATRREAVMSCHRCLADHRDQLHYDTRLGPTPARPGGRLFHGTGTPRPTPALGAH
ncbi:hypothetical protein GJU35_43685 [Streptomyces lincolnensis]|nr:hypothetical protein GJU35_01235 [Streptomyces lincolnensis]QMV11902.1 hypothetical protein GJU35_43685 [Streptomyces lincolnensis]